VSLSLSVNGVNWSSQNRGIPDARIQKTGANVQSRKKRATMHLDLKTRAVMQFTLKLMGTPFLRTYLDFYPQSLDQPGLINVFG
jgi:hypothetical protein